MFGEMFQYQMIIMKEDMREKQCLEKNIDLTLEIML